jgi:hypothetical protein
MFVKRQKYDKDFSSEDIHFPHVKGFYEGGSPYHKTDSLRMKYQMKYGDPPWEKCSGTGILDKGYTNGV